jgi:hypothetical protein
VTLHARQLKGGVIVDVVNVEQARIAEEAGACAVMALERVPADIRAEGGVARMSDPKMIKDIIAAVSIPVMAKVRIGHFVEAQVSSSFLFWAKASSSSSPASLLVGSTADSLLPFTFQIISQIGVDYIDESEVLTQADDQVCFVSDPFRWIAFFFSVQPYLISVACLSSHCSTTSTSTTSRSRSFNPSFLFLDSREPIGSDR